MLPSQLLLAGIDLQEVLRALHNLQMKVLAGEHPLKYPQPLQICHDILGARIVLVPRVADLIRDYFDAQDPLLEIRPIQECRADLEIEVVHHVVVLPVDIVAPQ